MALGVGPAEIGKHALAFGAFLSGIGREALAARVRDLICCISRAVKVRKA